MQADLERPGGSGIQVTNVHGWTVRVDPSGQRPISKGSRKLPPFVRHKDEQAKGPGRCGDMRSHVGRGRFKRHAPCICFQDLSLSCDNHGVEHRLGQPGEAREGLAELTPRAQSNEGLGLVRSRGFVALANELSEEGYSCACVSDGTERVGNEWAQRNEGERIE